MTDFEDANCPTWHNMLDSQINLRDAIQRTITFDDPKTGKHYTLNDEVAVLIARPRGWHLFEKHMLVDGKQVPAGIFDFGLYFFHNAQSLLDLGHGPYFYLPKMESHLEARLWNDIFVTAQDELGIPAGHHQGDGPHRDHHGDLRDARDPLRAARALVGPELRPLGLHLQLHQEVPRARHAAPGPQRR